MDMAECGIPLLFDLVINLLSSRIMTLSPSEIIEKVTYSRQKVFFESFLKLILSSVRISARVETKKTEFSQTRIRR